MKKIVLLISILVFSLVVLVSKDYWWQQSNKLISPWLPQKEKPRTLEKYSFENLRLRNYPGSQIKLEKVITQEKDYTSWLFSFETGGKKGTGQINIPLRLADARLGQARYPVIVMLRGYADDNIYFTGLGTRKAAGVFAQNGYITLAPDFLGFGGSDSSSKDILEARFLRPVEVLDLLASIKTLDKADTEKVFLWAHSNGGQIALSVLEISQVKIPTTLWAPVTRGFPESVLSFMGELDDQGKKVKDAIDDFLETYDAKLYSIDNFYADIQAPIQIHQGLADQLVRVSWSDEFVQKMKEQGKEINYYKYRGNDHNLKQSWDKVIKRDLEFFKKFL